MNDISIVSENGLLIRCGLEIDTHLTRRIQSISEAIRAQFGHEIIEVIPSYTTILVQFHPLKISHSSLLQQLDAILSDSTLHITSDDTQLIELPVYYSQETGPDLTLIAQEKGLSVDDVIKRHSQVDYTVCAIGFAPGFAFLASVDDSIATPRKKQPRLSLPAGSLGIADRQTAIYPEASPGGWQIIGNCPLPLFNPEQEPATPFAVGNTVRFRPISRDEYTTLGGKLCLNWKS